MRLKDREISVDVREELEAFEWERARWLEDRLIACSPFREERQPSFYVYLTDTETASAGVWQDSGSFDPEYSKGFFPKLLAYLRGESVDETIAYLLEKYGGYIDEERLQLRPHAAFKLKESQHMDKDALEPLMYRSPYLETRGISERIQYANRIGYDRESQAVTFPYFDAQGNLITIKYRSTRDKKFWYDRRGADVRNHIYGIRWLYLKRPETVVIVEGEIDALWLMECGYIAVATGNRFFSKQRADLIAKAPVDKVIIGSDNDAAGYEMQSRIVKGMDGRKPLYEWKLPPYAKDINDVRDKDEVRRIIESVERIDGLKPRLRL